MKDNRVKLFHFKDLDYKTYISYIDIILRINQPKGETDQLKGETDGPNCYLKSPLDFVNLAVVQSALDATISADFGYEAGLVGF